jgi:hypothetical protein
MDPSTTFLPPLSKLNRTLAFCEAEIKNEFREPFNPLSTLLFRFEWASSDAGSNAPTVIGTGCARILLPGVGESPIIALITPSIGDIG